MVAWNSFLIFLRYVVKSIGKYGPLGPVAVATIAALVLLASFINDHINLSISVGGLVVIFLSFCVFYVRQHASEVQNSRLAFERIKETGRDRKTALRAKLGGERHGSVEAPAGTSLPSETDAGPYE